jgi:(heptosyl)LPS beta-1,4-glucosyltransferase
LADFLSHTENVGIVSPLIVYKDNPQRIWATGSQLYPSLGRTRDPYHNHSLRSFAKSKKVDAVTGCAMMVRASILKDVGLFDETYFAYFEDVDLCYRARLYGHDICFYPFTRVYHSVSSAFKHKGSISKPSDYYMVKNRIYFMQKYSGRTKLFMFYGLLFPELVFSVFKNGVRLKFKKTTAFLAGIRDAFTRQVKEEYDSDQNRVSACIITRNAEDTIERCLQSLVGAVDETIILDSGSTDRTLSISRQYTDKIYTAEFQGDFSQLRNAAAGYATHPWILALDSDEYLSEELKGNIKHLTSAKKIWGFYLKRINYYEDRIIRHGYSGNDSLLRLYRKEGSFFHGKVHEKVITEGSVERTPFRVFHKQSSNNFTRSSFQTKWMSYIEIEAGEKAKQLGKRAFLYAAIAPFVFVAVFFKELVLLRSVLDGAKGLKISFFRSLYSYKLFTTIAKKKI